MRHKKFSIVWATILAIQPKWWAIAHPTKGRTEGNMEEWILCMLDGVEQTSLATIDLVNDIHALMRETSERVKRELPKIYSKG